MRSFRGRPARPSPSSVLRAVHAAARVFVIVLLAGCGGSSAPLAAGERRLALQTEDGLQVAATLYPVPAAQPPGLILAHRYGADAVSWRSFALAAQQEGYQVIAVDLRGHGSSTQRGEGRLDYRDVSGVEWLAAVADLRAARDALLAAGTDPENLAVLGEGLGANLALRYMRIDPVIQAAVMVSPVLDEYGFDSEADVRALRARPVLLVAAENDGPAAGAATALKQTAPGFSELRLYPGAASGTDVLAASEAAQVQVLGWLQAIIGKRLAAGAGTPGS